MREGAARGVAPAEHRGDARAELEVAERLDDVFVGAAREAAQALELAAPRPGQNDHRELGIDP